jgi:hypothetical protein
MVSQSVWIGITIGVFFVGLLIGYAALQSSATTMSMMNSQQMQQMMNDPQFMSQWQQQMIQNPQQMQQWMSSPEHVKQMETMMQENHDFMTQMMQVMIDNQELRLQMMGHMTENPEMMEQMQNIMEQGHMDSRMMSPQSLCQRDSGNWLSEFNECELISSEQCSIMGGTFKECESACRHNPDAENCTLQCIPVCVIP